MTGSSTGGISKLGSSQAGNFFGGQSKKTKRPWIIWCAVKHTLKRVFKLTIAIYQTYILPSHEKITKQESIVVSDKKTLERWVSSTFRKINVSKGKPAVHGRCEMDSHFDTTVAGKNYAILRYTDRSCDIVPFLDKYAPMKDVPIFQQQPDIHHQMDLTTSSYLMRFYISQIWHIP